MPTPTIDFVCEEPTALHFQGEEAKREFERLLDCASAETAVGGIFGYRWAAQGCSANWTTAPVLIRILEPAKLNTYDFNMIVIDSGNTDGDSWKFIYHPTLQSGTFMKEN